MTQLDHAPFTPFMAPHTATPPGVGALDEAAWLHRDAAFAAQMAYRDRLIAERRETVFACTPEAEAPARELLGMVAAAIARDPGYRIGSNVATRPDGVPVDLDGDHPLIVAGRLAQEDFCLLAKAPGAAEHRLIGAILCFPARWSLAEKLGRPLVGVHEGVPGYAGGLSRRVQRLFDTLRPDRPLVRANWLVHSTPELHQPLTEAAKARRHSPAEGRFFLRVERQCLLKTPRAGAAIFSIKTCVTPIEALTPDQRAGLIAALDDSPAAMRAYHGGAAHHDAARAALVALS